MEMPPLPIMPSNSGAPRPTGMLAQSGTTSSSDPSSAITGFINNFLTMKTAVKDHYKQKFLEGVQLAAQGIPIDQEKVMKYAKKAGMDYLPTEPPTPQEQLAKTQQNVQQQVQNQTQIPGIPQGPDAAMQSMLAQATQFGQARPQPTSLLGKLGQKLGVSGQSPVSNASPMGQWLTGLQAAGQTSGGMAGRLGRENALQRMVDHLKEKGLDVQNMSDDHQMQLFQMMKSAVNGGPDQPQHIENLVRLGVMKDIPLDEFTAAMRRISPEMPAEEVSKNAASAYMYGKMGGPQMRLAQLNMAKEMLPFMGNDMSKSLKYISDIFTQGGSTVTPQMSSEQYKQQMEGTKTLSDAYPTAPMNLISAVSHSQLLGNQDTTGQLMKILSDYPRQGTVELKKHQDTLGYDYASLSQKAQNEAGLLNLGVATQLGKKNQESFDNWFKLATNKELDPTGDATRAAFEGMASALDKDAKLTLNYRGSEIPLGVGDVSSISNWRPTWPGGKPFLQMNQTPDSVLNKFLQPDQLGEKTSAIKEFAQKAASMPDGREKLQALGSVAQALQQVPKPARLKLIQQLNLPSDMKKAAQQLIEELPETITLGSGKLQ